MRVSSILLFLVIAGCFAAPWARAEVLTNDDIKKMTSAGVPAGAIAAKIGVSQTDFDTSVEGLIDLASAGVDKSVIEAMTKSAAGPVPSDSVPSEFVAAAGADSATPFAGSPCTTAGIFSEQDGSLAALEVAALRLGKKGGLFMQNLTYGMTSSKNLGIVTGAKSPTRIANQSPVFLFCLEEDGQVFSVPGIRDVLNPSDILLIPARTNARKKQRTITLSKISVWQGEPRASPPDDVQETTYEELAAGAYRVTPVNELEAGEYAFYKPVFQTEGSKSNAASSRIYAFGVD